MLLKIDGDDLVWAPHIQRLEFSESLDALDLLTVELEAPLGEARADFLDRLKPGCPYVLTIGARELKGDITRVEYHRTTRATTTVRALGLETLHRLRHKRHTKMDDRAKHEIVKELVESVGLSATTQAVTATAEEVVFLDEDSLATVKRLADERNYAVSSDGTNLNFAPRNVADGGGSVAVPWLTHVRSCELATDIGSVVTSVKVVGYDYVKDEAVEYEATATDLTGISGGDDAVALREGSIGALAVQLNERITAAVQTECKETAIADLQRRAETFLSGRVVIEPSEDEVAPGRNPGTHRRPLALLRPLHDQRRGPHPDADRGLLDGGRVLLRRLPTTVLTRDPMEPLHDPAVPLGATWRRDADPAWLATRVRMALETQPGRVPWLREFGCDLDRFVGASATEDQLRRLRSVVRRAVELWVPGVTVEDVQVRLVHLPHRSAHERHPMVPLAEAAMTRFGVQGELHVGLQLLTGAGTVGLDARIPA